MKRHLLTLAIAACVLPLAAQAAPRVYGTLNLSIDYMDASVTPTMDGWALNSNESRIGVKGAEKLNDEYTAVYKMEWEVQGDMSANKDLNSRERYLGITHYQWGTVRLGRIDSPFRNAEDDIDVFDDLVTLDMETIMYGQNRLDNSINYVSPKFLDVFGINFTMQPGEGHTTTPSATGKTGNENHLADGYSAAFSYEDDTLYLSYAFDKEIRDARPVVSGFSSALSGVDMDAMRFNARYKMGDAIISGLYQTAEPTRTTKVTGSLDQEDSFIISGSYKIDLITLRAEVLVSEQDIVGGSSADTTLFGVGADYNMTENTKLFANVANKTLERTRLPDLDTSYLGVGAKVRF